MVHTLVLNGHVFLKVGSGTALTLVRLTVRQAEKLVHDLTVTLQEYDQLTNGVDCLD
jgi:hypothetical protein